MSLNNSVRTKICAQCNARFLCGPSSSASCWCNEYPAIFQLEDVSECLCEICLKKAMIEKISKYAESIDPSKIDQVEIKKYKTSNSIEGIDYYVENGMYVFTRWYHLKRGYCCESGCRHCPFGLLGFQ